MQVWGFRLKTLVVVKLNYIRNVRQNSTESRFNFLQQNLVSMTALAKVCDSNLLLWGKLFKLSKLNTGTGNKIGLSHKWDEGCHWGERCRDKLRGNIGDGNEIGNIQQGLDVTDLNINEIVSWPLKSWILIRWRKSMKRWPLMWRRSDQKTCKRHWKWWTQPETIFCAYRRWSQR